MVSAIRRADEKRAMHSVYVVGARGDYPFKVGRSSKLIDRFTDFQSGSPVPLVLYFHEKVEGRHRACDVEWYAHRLLREYHVWGEWFACSLSDAVTAVRYSLENAKPKPDYYKTIDQEKRGRVRDRTGMTRLDWRKRTADPANEDDVLRSISKERFDFGQKSFGRLEDHGVPTLGELRRAGKLPLLEAA